MSALMARGLEITLLGMGAVFVLLALLVLVVQGMSRFAHLVGGPPSAPVSAAPAPSDAALTAAITAAIHAFRARRQRKH